MAVLVAVVNLDMREVGWLAVAAMVGAILAFVAWRRGGPHDPDSPE